MGVIVFIHCNKKFKPVETWFLYPNDDFIKRKLFLGTCPICGADVVKLVETRKSDLKTYQNIFYKKAAVKLISLLIKQVEYTDKDIKKIKKNPFGLCYGENVEIHNSKGQIIKIKQKRCDYFGAKELTQIIHC